MLKLRNFLVFLAMMLVFISSQISAREYFLYDAETKKILYMDGKSAEFIEKLEMNKNPDYLMPTNKPDKFLAIYTPEITEGKSGLFSRKKLDSAQPGQLILFNVATGRTEDLIELGYGPFNYDCTEDRKHFAITYRTSLEDSSTFETLYYNIAEQKS